LASLVEGKHTPPVAHRSRRYSSRIIALATVVAALAAAPKAQAQAYFWAGGGFDLWSTSNWYGYSPTGSATTDLYFGINSSNVQTPDNNGVVTNDLADNFFLRNLNFFYQGWAMGGKSLRFAAGGSINAIAANATVSNKISLDGGLNVVASGGALTLSGIVSGTGSVIAAGNGTVTLSGLNTYTGGTTVNGSRLVDLHPHGAYTISQTATLELQNASDVTLASTITGSGNGNGAFVKSGAGTLTLGAAHSFFGGTTVTGGRLIDQFPHSYTSYALTNSSTLELSPAAVVDAALSISGAGSFVKSGNGQISFGSQNTYTGSTTINAGLLRIFTQDAIPTATSLVVNGTGVLDLNSANQTVASLAGSGTVRLNGGALTVNQATNTTFSGAIAYAYTAGSLTKNGAGTLTLTGVNNYSGGTTVNGGRLVDANPHGTYVDNSELEFAPATNFTYGTPIDGPGSFIKSGAGTLTFTGTNGYSGSTRVLGGRLVENSPHGSYTGANATLEFATATTADFYGTILLDPTAGGDDSKKLTFVKSGAGTLTLYSQYNHFDTRVKAGTLRTWANSALGYGAMTIDSGATLDLAGTSQAVTTLSGTGSLKLGTGGVFQIAEGTSTFFGDISGTGFLANYAPSILTLAGTNTSTAATYAVGGTIRAGVDDALGQTDLVVVSGDLDLYGHAVSVKSVTFDSFGVNEYATFGTVKGAGTLKLGGDITLNFLADGNNTPVLIPSNIALAAGQHAVKDNGNLSNSTYYESVLSGVISGVGGLDFNNTGRYYALTGKSTYTGPTNVNVGALFLGRANALPSNTALTVAQNAFLALAPWGTENGVTAGSYSQTVGSLSGGGVIYVGDATLTVGNSTDSTFSGVINGLEHGALVKQGTGTLTLSGAVTYGGAFPYAGGTTVNGGRLIDAKPHGNYVTNAALEFAIASDQTYAGSITGTGSFTKSGLGALTLNGMSNFGSPTEQSGGILRNGVNNALPTGSSLIVRAGGTYDLNGKTQTVRGLLGDGAVTLKNGQLTAGNSDETYFSGTISGPGTFIKSGSGFMALTGLVESAANVQIAAGRLKSSAKVIKGDVTGAAGTTLQFEESKAATYEGTFSGAGALLKTGSRSLTLANAPSNTGGIHVAGGSLSVDAGGAFGGGLTVDQNTTFLNTSDDLLTIGGRTYVQGIVDTTEDSTTVFTGLVSGAGSFAGFGHVEFDGGYSPGNSPASVTFQGDVNFSSDLTMELGGTTLGTGYDHLNVLGTAALGGNLTVAYYNGFSAALGQSFDLFDFNSSNGAFATLILPTLGTGLVWNTSGLYTTGILSVQAQAVPEPASLVALGLGGLVLVRRRRK
jgi:fibronectin-binding autotransporter adhesin